MSVTATSATNNATEPETLEMDPRNHQHILKKILLAINLIASFVLIGVAIVVIYHCFKIQTVLFSWHPSLMALGYLVLMSQGFLAMSDHNYATRLLTYKARVFTHWMIQLTALILIGIGFTSIYVNKERANKLHFQSIHGILGLTTFGLTILSSVGGVFNKYSFKFKNILKPAITKILHSLAGIISYVLAIVTIGFGLYSDWFKNNVETEGTIIFLIVIVVLSAVIILGKPLILLKTRYQNLVKRL